MIQAFLVVTPCKRRFDTSSYSTAWPWRWRH